MFKFKSSSFRSTLLVAALVLSVGFASAQVTSQEPVLNPKIQAAAQPYKDTRRVAESLARFQALNAQTPGDPDVLSWLGFLYIQAGTPEKAIAPLEEAAAKRPENLEVQINLGNAYFSSNPPQYDKALASYAKVSQGRPTMSEPRYNSGVIYIQKRDYPKAILELKAAEALAPKNPYIKNNLGVAYEKSKNEKDAATKFQQASDLMPEDKTFARNAGLAILKTKPADEIDRKPYEDKARPYLEKADPNDPAVALALGSMASDPAKALTYYETAEKGIDDPKYGYSLADRETYWYNLGVLRSLVPGGGGSDGALRAYERALTLRPNDIDALKNLGMLHYQRAERSAGNHAEYADAETAFDRLTGLNPSSFDAWMNLGLAATKANNQAKAITAYREAVKLGGAGEAQRLISVHLGLADQLYKRGDASGAAAQYREVLQMKKDSPEALNGLGLIYLDGQKNAQAEAAFRSAIAANPKYVAAYNNLAIALDRLFRRKEAIGMLERARALAPLDKDIRDNLQRLKGA